MQVLATGAGALCALPSFFLPKRPGDLMLQKSPSSRLSAVQSALVSGGATPVIEESGLVDVEGTTQNLSEVYCVIDLEDLRLLSGAVGELRAAQQSRNWLNSLKSTKYDEENASHERLLEELWTAAFPEKRRVGGRYTKEWGELGFQGLNPATDFRGGGILSLAVMVHLARIHPGLLRSILNEGGSGAHATSWYMYAVSSINFTSDLLKEFDPLKPQCQGCMGMDLLNALSKFGPTSYREGSARATSLPDHPVVAAFGDVQSDFARHFHARWVAKRPPVMEFNQFKAGCKVASARPPPAHPQLNSRRQAAPSRTPSKGGVVSKASYSLSPELTEAILVECTKCAMEILFRAAVSRLIPG